MNYLVIHKKEWDRIRRADNTTRFKERESITKSQECIEKYNDNLQGAINSKKKQKQIKAIPKLKDLNSTKKLNNKDIIEKAKELIFEDSCYGRQLLSALLESKALEERDAQIKFNNEIKEKYKIQKSIEPKATSLQIGNNSELEEEQRSLNQKQMNVKIALINKTLCERKYRECNEKKNQEKQEQIENERSIQKILQNEIKLETGILNRENEDVKKYEEQNDRIKKSRAEEAERDDRIRKVWCKYDERIKRRENTVFDKIHKESCNTIRSQNAFKIIEQLNYEKDKKYIDFIEKGVIKHVKRLNEQDQQEFESKTIDRNKRKLVDKDNKLLIELKRRIDLNIDSNCTRGRDVKGTTVRTYKEKTTKAAQGASTPTFLVPSNKLLENLKTRVSDSFCNVGGSHAQFAEHAAVTLRQCHYKNMARKVINDYRRINCIDEKKMPIPD